MWATSRNRVTPAKQTPQPTYPHVLPKGGYAELLPAKQLEDYSVAEVCACLSELNLAQYVPAFEREQITGRIFAHLDDDMLASDLGISSKLHRLKITKFIADRQAAGAESKR